MFSYEDRLRAVRLYIKLGKRLGLIICQRGTPRGRNHGVKRRLLKEVCQHGHGVHLEFIRCMHRERMPATYLAPPLKWSLRLQADTPREFRIEFGLLQLLAHNHLKFVLTRIEQQVV